MAMAPPSLLIILLLISLHHLQTNSQHNLSSEQTILLRLRQQWSYASFSLIRSWNSTSSPCTWPLVSCIDDMVTGLGLSQQYLLGRIPSSICLVWIDMSHNELGGNIPACLRNCSNLQHLDLSWNYLSGTIPGQLFLMESLVNLSLSGNGLYGNIPMTIEKAKNLENLDLSGNYLNGSIPDGIAYPYNLSDLDLSYNEFRGEIPDALFLLESLVNLSLSGNGLYGNIPMTIEKAKNLENLDLSGNYLNGSIPDGIAYPYNLSDLDLSDNLLSGEIPDALFLLESLVTFSLHGNRLYGRIPMTIEKASSLERLDLSYNNLNGSIPDGIAYPHSLSYLDLSINELSGEIPGALFLMENLVYLYLSGNGLYGNIPTTIEKASCLEYLDLSSNSLGGSIPDSITYPQSLSYLNLSINEFSGEIPGALFLMENLVYLCLSGNRLYGNIPTTIENASCLVYLDLSNNSFCGSIPDSITYPYNLSHLDLSRNSFSGEIPSRLLRTRRLQYLSLSYNNLTGLPPYIDLGALQLLNLTHNRLRGPIPKRFGITSDRGSCHLDLSNNQLSGEIADIIINDILNSALLPGINLCNNEFSGIVPDLFVDVLFPNGCLNRSNICYVKWYTNKSLPRCSASLCSYYRFHGHEICGVYQISEHKKSHHSIIVFALGIAAGVGVALSNYLTRKCKKVLISDPNMKEEEKWKVISFQGLKFETTDILPCLTDENLIGNGGSGKVYRVLINQTSSYVAVKSISISKVSDHQAEKEFLAEIQTLGAVWHYNIIKLLCYISGPDKKLLVYEYFENKSLDRWLHGNASVTKLDWPTRMNIAIGAAQGFCYMHHHCPIPILHRDIKSSNILLDSDFNAKIADFGLAKLLNTCGDTETASAVAGTFGYIAPEYAYTSKVNAKSDVYSFGVVLLELTTGRKAVTRGDHLNLGGWAHLQCKDTGATIDALDDEIKEATVYLDEVISVFRLGVVCTSALPSSRPSMKDCLHILMNCSNKCSSSSAAA